MSGNRKHDRLDWVEERCEKLHDKCCRLEERVRAVEAKEARHESSIKHILALVSSLPEQLEERINRLEERMVEPLTQYEKAKIGVIVGIIGVIVGMMLNGS